MELPGFPEPDQDPKTPYEWLSGEAINVTSATAIAPPLGQRTPAENNQDWNVNNEVSCFEIEQHSDHLLSATDNRADDQRTTGTNGGALPANMSPATLLRLGSPLWTPVSGSTAFNSLNFGTTVHADDQEDNQQLFDQIDDILDTTPNNSISPAFGAPKAAGDLITPESWLWMGTPDENHPSEATTPSADNGTASYPYMASTANIRDDSIPNECPHTRSTTTGARIPGQLSMSDHEFHQLTSGIRTEITQNTWVTSPRQPVCQPPSIMSGNELKAERRDSSLLGPPMRIHNPNGAASAVLGPCGSDSNDNRVSRRRTIILRQSEEALAQVSRARRNRAAADQRWQNLAHQSLLVRTRLNRIGIPHPAPSAYQAATHILRAREIQEHSQTSARAQRANRLSLRHRQAPLSRRRGISGTSPDWTTYGMLQQGILANDIDHSLPTLHQEAAQLDSFVDEESFPPEDGL